MRPAASHTTAGPEPSVTFLRPFLNTSSKYLQNNNPQVVTVGLGSAENARFFSQTLDYPLQGLYADPTGAAYKAIGFYAPQGDVNPYVKLLAMLTGIGSPGTVQEVSRVSSSRSGKARHVWSAVLLAGG
jgi:hypothetical protein